MHSRTRTVTSSLVLLLLGGAAACTGADDDPRRSGSATGQVGDQVPARVDFEAPTRRQLAKGVRLGDQSDQALGSVASSGTTVVAAGRDSSYNTTRPLVLTSKDSGSTWQRADVEPDGEAGGGEAVTSVAAGDGRFVAVGRGADGHPVVRASADGLDWQRHEDHDAFLNTDSFSRVRFLDGRFHVIGANSAKQGEASNRLVWWVSDDGTGWERRDLSERGVTAGGSLSAADLAKHGRDLVLFGGVEDAELTEQPNRIAIWRSSDRGETFSAERVATDFAGDFRAYAREALVVGGRLLLTASGDAPAATESWDGVVMARSGGAWRKIAPAGFRTPGEEHPAALLQAGGTWVMAGSNTAVNGDEDAVVLSGRSPEALRPVTHPSLGGRGEQDVNAAAAVEDGGVVLVGTTARTGADEAAVWVLRKGRLTPVALPPEASEGRPSALVSELFAVGDGFLALGSSAASGVVWTSDDLDDWQAEGLSGRSARSSFVDVADGTVLPDGRVVLVGARGYALGSQGIAWVGRPGAWREVGSPAFRGRGESGYYAVRLGAVASNGRVVVAVGGNTVNGNDEAHPVYADARARRWSPGTAGRPLPGSREDNYHGRTPYAAFRAPANGSLAMNDVVALGRGFLAGGARSRAAEGLRPVVWTSRDGRDWTSPVALPHPRRAHASWVASLVRRGGTVIATGGYQQSEDDSETGWVSWVSTDGGRTWSQASVVAQREAHVASVVVLPGGFVAMGSSGPQDNLDAAMWVSTDGLTWEALGLETPRADGVGHQFLSAGVVDGDELRLVGGDIPPAGGGYFAASMPLPEP